MTAYFGEWPFLPPMLIDAVPVDVPLGEPCLFCEDPIQRGEPGVMRPYIDRHGEAWRRPVHRECDARQVLGGVNHQLGRCSCQGGSEDPDPPGVSRHEAARMALAYFEHGTLPNDTP